MRGKSRRLSRRPERSEGALIIRADSCPGLLNLFTPNLLPALHPPMPIHCPIATQRITQNEFKQIAGEVMRHVFTIHNEFGRFFDEQIYTKELVDRMDGVELEVPVTVTHDSFSIGLYDEAVTHFLGGEDRVLLPVP